MVERSYAMITVVPRAEGRSPEMSGRSMAFATANARRRVSHTGPALARDSGIKGVVADLRM